MDLFAAEHEIVSANHHIYSAVPISVLTDDGLGLMYIEPARLALDDGFEHTNVET